MDWTMRAKLSVAPPGADVTTNSIGLVGFHWAWATLERPSSETAASNAVVSFIRLLLSFWNACGGDRGSLRPPELAMLVSGGARGCPGRQKQRFAAGADIGHAAAGDVVGRAVRRRAD